MNTVQINEKIFSVSVADNYTAWQQGLGGKDGLTEDEGMLFVYPLPSRQVFWMKGMKFSIDIIFADETGKVVAVHRNCAVEPEHDIINSKKYPSYHPIRYALEVNAGSANDVNIDDMLIVT